MFAVGQSIGSYRIVRKLGQGGMGAVFEVIHEELARRAAIKVLHPEYAKEEHSIQRFFNEARAVNIIRHPGLVGIFESGRLDDGCAFIVMEFLDGQLLGQRLESVQHLPLREVLHLGRQIAAALDVAHQKGIVHRDLKPDNIMIVPDPETPDGERVKIFDFGLAKLRLTSLAQAAGPTALHTQPGMIMGTPTYMAPEQCRSASNIDGKADVYSLGVVLYQALVGHAPFFADNVGELMTMHMRDPPPSLRKLDPAIPRGLADLVHSMPAKESGARPDMKEVCSRLVALSKQRTRRASDPPISRAGQAAAHPATGGAASARSDHGDERALRTPEYLQPVAEPGRGSRQLLVATSVAVVLVAVSGALLFSSKLPAAAAPAPSGPRAAAAEIAPPVPQGLAAAPVAAREPERESGRESEKGPEKESQRESIREPVKESEKELIGEAEPRVSAPSSKPAAAAEPAAAAAQRAAAPAPILRWQLASRPSGASVVRADDGRVLGRTPWSYEQAQQPGLLRLKLRLGGYEDAGVILDLTSASRQTLMLAPRKDAMRASLPTPPRPESPR
jgi:serine/threonine-protein kinase